MPVLAIPAVGVLLIAVLALLLLMSWQQFANALSKLFPTWHIPGFGSLRGWITDHIGDAFSEVAGYLDKYILPALQFVTSPFVVIMALVNEFGALDRALYDFGVRTVTVTIPRAVAVLRAEAAALELRVKAYALTLRAQAELYAHGLFATVEAEARAWALAARADALRWATDAEVYAHGQALAVQAVAVHLADDARAFAARLYNDGTAFTRAQVATAEAAAAGLFRQAEASIELRFGQAKAYADAAAKLAASTALAGLAGQLATDLDQLWPAVPAVIDDVIDVAGGAFTDVVSDLRGLSRGIPAGLPAAIAASLGIAIPLLRLAKDCTIPNCRNLSQVGRDLQSLFGLVEDGALLALLAAAAADPEGAATDALTGLAGGMTNLANEFADLIGVG